MIQKHNHKYAQGATFMREDRFAHDSRPGARSEVRFALRGDSWFIEAPHNSTNLYMKLLARSAPNFMGIFMRL